MSDNSSGTTGLSALLSFRARNVRSYRDEVELTLLGTRLSMDTSVRELRVAYNKRPIRVLPVAGVFGANASGKSQLLKAMANMRGIVATSFRRGDRRTSIHRCPFLLDEGSKSAPSEFHVELILQGRRWLYGLEVDDKRVLEEYAFHYPRGRQALVFERSDGEVKFGPSFRSGGRDLQRLLRENALVLSVAGAVGDEALTPLFEWFLDNLRLADMPSRGIRAALTADLANEANEPETRESVLGLLRAADLGITDIKRLSPDPELVERAQRALRILKGTEGDPEADDEQKFILDDFIRLTHQGSSSNVLFEPEDESAGTAAWVSLIGPVLDTLSRGNVLLADELDNSLHPHLVERLVELFQDPHTNRHCAQLIFNAHDVSLLGDSRTRLLGRDQIWTTEKDLVGATSLHSLADYRLRKNEALERPYLQGRFGGVPVLDEGELELAIELINT